MARNEAAKAGPHRRELLRMSAASFCGLALTDFLRADARAALIPYDPWVG